METNFEDNIHRLRLRLIDSVRNGFYKYALFFY